MPTVIDAVGTPVAIVGRVGLVTYGIYASHRRRMPKTNLAFMCLTVLLIGYGSYTLVYVRSATEPSIDMNDPDNIERFIDYLEREQYGATPLLSGVSFDDESGRVNPREGKETSFPRRHSTTPQHWKVYERYNSDLGFFLHYQVGYMYMRYFFWNFVGRTSDVQGASWTTGIPGQDPGAESQASMQTPSQKKSHNVYFALPLLLGLSGPSTTLIATGDAPSASSFYSSSRALASSFTSIRRRCSRASGTTRTSGVSSPSVSGSASGPGAFSRWSTSRSRTACPPSRRPSRSWASGSSCFWPSRAG
jgi:hypothetical protein